MNRFLTLCVALLLATPACAADMPPKPVYKAAPVVAPAHSWTGYYFGAHAGAAFGRQTANFSGDPFLGQFFFVGFAQNGFFDPPLANQLRENSNGFMGGAQAGYNQQMGNVVLGIEGDISWMKLKGSSASSVLDPPIHVFTMQHQGSVDWLATARGRLGVLPTDRLLVYATAGVAIAHIRQSLTFAHTGGIVDADDLFGGLPGAGGGLVCLTFGGPCLAGASSQTAFGGAGGGGLEYAISNNVTIRGEYLYVGLPSRSVTAASTGQFHAGFTNSPLVFIKADATTQLQIARVAFNLRF